MNASTTTVCTFEVPIHGEEERQAVQARIDALTRLLVRSEQSGVQFQGWLFRSVSAKLPDDGSDDRMIVKLVRGVELPTTLNEKINPRQLFEDALALPSRIGVAPGVWLERSLA
ncbi:MAG TPA: hypothetical protein VFY73_08370 [Ideonella sp.]|uniref:hypothetical protein n=1 Tax=Ideonella sp. TaxID=1929293 RepID=UPI002E31BAB8|nr:hypothetical protein [Ideonella sp.]HEX5684036.1 hypothetical protein [Ideonella sp.]